ncbi:MAG: ATP-binding protein [Candidatus Scalindua sp.]|nr:ATP-binding protein [Candidatus Scalindua sp.]
MKKHIHIKRGIRWKLLSTLIGLIVGLLIIITVIQILVQKKFLERDLDNRITSIRTNIHTRGKTLSNYLARLTENAIESFKLTHITRMIKQLVADDEDLKYIILSDYSSRAYIHTLKPELEQEILSSDEDWFAVNQSNAIIHEFERDGISFLEFVVPINKSANPWGVLRLGYSLNMLNKEIADSREEIMFETRHIVVWSIVISTIFIWIAVATIFMISTRISSPLVNLTKSVWKLSDGDFSAMDTIKIKSSDEIGMLGNAFIEMSRNLRESHRKLEKYSRILEEKVEDRTLRLKVANTALKEKDNMKTEFLSTVSHELRTPLALVMGFAKIIKKRLDDVILPHTNINENKVRNATQQVKDNINIIMLEGKRLADLVNDLLDISKIEAGEVEWKMEPIQVSDIIDRAAIISSNYLQEKKIDLIKDLEDDLPSIIGDSDRMIQVVINLISNAMKFTKKGSITLRARNLNNEIVISIIDTGIGIAVQNQKKIFEKFKQVGDTITDKPQGTGLGLSICKQIVEHHGGRIWVESEWGKGSTFSFALPCNGASNDIIEKNEEPIVTETGVES